jgi:hypothetical protein
MHTLIAVSAAPIPYTGKAQHRFYDFMRIVSCSAPFLRSPSARPAVREPLGKHPRSGVCLIFHTMDILSPIGIEGGGLELKQADLTRCAYSIWVEARLTLCYLEEPVPAYAVSGSSGVDGIFYVTSS